VGRRSVTVYLIEIKEEGGRNVRGRAGREETEQARDECKNQLNCLAPVLGMGHDMLKVRGMY
jgi:hypothetical protein